MGEHHGQAGHRHIGDYLRGVRESRRLTLDAVEEMTGTLPGCVTKSYLSRIENGRLEPTFPRLYALSQVYGVPIASFAEQFEVDLRRRAAPDEFMSRPSRDLQLEIEEIFRSGGYADSLRRIECLLDRLRDRPQDCEGIDEGQMRIYRIGCLIYLDRFRTAKDDCEDLLSEPDIEPRLRAFALYQFARCCYRLGKLPLALMAIGTLENDLPAIDDPALSVGNLVSLKGNILSDLNSRDEALAAFREAVTYFEAAGDTLSTCRHRINYAMVLVDAGKPREAKRHLSRALVQARDQGFVRQTAFALHGLGRAWYDADQLDSAESHFVESNRISREQEYVSMIFCNCYYLRKIALTRDDRSLAAAHQRTMRSYLRWVPEALAEARAFRSADTGGAA